MSINYTLIYKPSFVMEWRESRVQGKTLCKVTVGAGGTAAFPEETRVNVNTFSMTHLVLNNLILIDVSSSFGVSKEIMW